MRVVTQPSNLRKAGYSEKTSAPTRLAASVQHTNDGYRDLQGSTFQCRSFDSGGSNACMV